MSFIVDDSVADRQYFVWFLPLLAPILPRLHLSRTRSVALVGLWVTAQALWLLTAFRLEFLGEAVHLGLWMAGLGLLMTSTWIVGQLLDSFGQKSPITSHSDTHMDPVSPGKKRRRKKRHSASAGEHSVARTKDE